MVEYSARALREAELRAVAEEARADPQRYRQHVGLGPHHPLPNPNPTVQPVLPPAEGTGVVLIVKDEWPEEGWPAGWDAQWYGGADPDAYVWCPVHHEAGVFEWARRQPAARHVVRLVGDVESPLEDTTPTNRKPEPGTGLLFIDHDEMVPIWVGSWADQRDGLDVFTDDDLRVVIDWAQRQPAAGKLFIPIGRSDFIDLDDFLADPERHLHWEYRSAFEGLPVMSEGESSGWTGGWTMPANDDHMRAVLDALEQGDTAKATLHMMASLQGTLAHLDHQIAAINLREGRNDYPPEAEPYFDKAMRFAEAGEYEKSIAYGILNVGALVDSLFPRMDEIIHELRRPR